MANFLTFRQNTNDTVTIRLKPVTISHTQKESEFIAKFLDLDKELQELIKKYYGDEHNGI